MSNDSRTISIAYSLFLTSVCAIALAGWRLTDQGTFALWTLTMLLLLHRWLRQRTPGNCLSWFGTTIAVVGGVLILGGNGYADRLFFADRLDADVLPGLEWCSGHSDHSLFLVMVAVLAHSAIPTRRENRQRLLRVRTISKAVLVLVSFALLFSMSIDVASLPAFADLSIEKIRSRIVETALPGVSIAKHAVPRTEFETQGFIVATLVTTALALIGLVIMIASKRPRRMVGLALAAPGGIWLLLISFGGAHRVSPYVFEAIAESVDPVVILLWLSACALAAHRLGSRIDERQSPSQDSSPLLDASTFVAACYTLYERRVVQSVVEGHTSFTDVLSSLSMVFVDVTALVLLLTSMRNLAARTIGISVRVPTSGETGTVAVLFVQLVLIGPLCVLAGSVYWIIRFG